MAAPSTPPPSASPASQRSLVVVIVVLAVLLALALVAVIVLAVRGPATTTAGTPPPGSGTSVSSPAAGAGTSSTSVPATTASSSSTTTASASSTLPPGTTQTCVSSRVGLRLSYPTGWHTASEPDWACMLFDPDPFVVPEQSELPHVAVVVVPHDADFATATSQALATQAGTIQSQEPTTLGGRKALCIVEISNGQGLLEAGTRSYTCYVDFGTKVFSFGNVRVPSAPDRGFDAAVRSVAASAVLT